MDDFITRVRHKLKVQTEKDLYRTLRVMPRGMIDFTSNDYLGLGRSARLHRLIHERFQNLDPLRNGSGGSRLLSGNTELAEDTEHFLASVFGAEAALIFSSGYMANLGVLSSLPQRGDTIVYDEQAHACIKDGARLSAAQRHSFRHNDLHDLERKVRVGRGQIFIAVESVYSMDGDECPLHDLHVLAARYDAIIILDEAHATGAFGDRGAGLAASLGLQHRIPIRIMTFGKAMGVHGACVVCTKDIRNYLINFSRPFIYTTAFPPHSLVAIKSAFEYLASVDGLQNKLIEKINLFRRVFAGGTGSKSAIQPVYIRGNERARMAAGNLQRQGFDVRPILSPTVREGAERVRICIHTFNEDSHVEDLAAELNRQHVDQSNHAS